MFFYDLSLYLVTDSELSLGRPLLQVVDSAVRGGVSIVQLREKRLATESFIELGKQLKQTLDRYNIPLIINDRVDVAKAVSAAGVHLGQADTHYSDARKILGGGCDNWFVC